MFWDIFYQLLKVFGMLIAICIVRAVLKNNNVQAKIKRLEAQGIVSYPGNDTFLLGPMINLQPQYVKEQEGGKVVLPNIIIWAFEKICEKTRQPGDPKNDATKNRMIAFNFLGNVVTYI